MVAICKWPKGRKLCYWTGLIILLIMFGKDSMSTDDQTYIGNFLNSRNASTTTIRNLSLSRICQEVSYYTTLVTKLTLS